ncbi:hypothetical protein Q5N45_14575 [Vibrio cholerae]|uniref:hypothetical protein n=1 Tax=Vibrio cholerae TaxID=666 RepID=UPI00053BD3A1|nr:hypothetical protein [Vibrio cholerae]EKF9749339.1 hypothetical protein [Vibrio cholerae]MDV2340267.1 hypothetical protein [Vibrio cholerae]BCN19346.1 putative O-antigen polymerase [Vibrio cholerae]GIB93398.1 hypothetical protein VCSRO190_2726 [Vibrio cholerae]
MMLFKSFDAVIFIILTLTTLFFTSSFSFMGISQIGVLILLVVVLFMHIYHGLKIFKPNIYVIFLCIIINLSLLIRMINTPGVYYAAGSDINSMILITCYLYCSMFLFYFYDNKRNRFGTIIKLIIYFHVFALVFQFLTYQTTGYNIDISSFLGGEGNRTSKPGTIIFRPTGVFDEPSIYCGFIILLLCVYNYINSKDFLCDTIVGFSIFLTMSFAGYIMLFFYFFIKYFKLNKWSFLLTIIMLCSTYTFFTSNEYILDRLFILIDGDDSSTLFKKIFLDYWNSIPVYKYTGMGISNDLSRPDFFDAAYDLTFWGASIIIYGYYFSVAIFFIILYSFPIRVERKHIIMLIPLLKVTVLHMPIFIIYFTVIQYSAKDKRVEHN